MFQSKKKTNILILYFLFYIQEYKILKIDIVIYIKCSSQSDGTLNNDGNKIIYKAFLVS